MENEKKNPLEGVDHSDMTDDEKRHKGIETDAERDERMSKQASEKKSDKPKTKRATKPKAPKAPKEKKPKAPKAAKPKKPAKVKKAAAGDRAPRVVLSDKQQAESRVSVRILPAVMKMIERFAKYKGLDIPEAADKMITVAEGRLNALHRYNEG